MLVQGAAPQDECGAFSGSSHSTIRGQEQFIDAQRNAQGPAGLARQDHRHGDVRLPDPELRDLGDRRYFPHHAPGGGGEHRLARHHARSPIATPSRASCSACRAKRGAMSRRPRPLAAGLDRQVLSGLVADAALDQKAKPARPCAFGRHHRPGGVFRPDLQGPRRKFRSGALQRGAAPKRLHGSELLARAARPLSAPPARRGDRRRPADPIDDAGCAASLRRRDALGR